MQTQLIALFVCFEGALVFVLSMASLSMLMQEPGWCYLCMVVGGMATCTTG